MASGDVVNTAARLQAAAPVERRARRRDDLSRHTRRRRLPRAPSPSRRRARRSRSQVWEAIDARARLGVDVAHDARTRARRPRDASSAVLRAPPTAHATSGSPSSSRSSVFPGMGRAASLRRAARDRRRRTGAHVVAAGSLSRRTATASPSGRSPRSSRHRPASSSRTRRRPRARSCAAAVSDVIDDGRRGSWVERHLRPLVGLDDDPARRRSPGRDVRRLAALLRGAG